MPNRAGEVTRLLRRMQAGDREAADLLLTKVMGELRRLARHYMRNERVGHTLQPTALVNEAYLRLAGYDRMDWQSRSHFVAVAASVMRQILIDYARRRQASKRGSGEDAVALDEERDTLSVEQSAELMILEDALIRLQKMNERQAKVVEMRYFGGLSVEETAEALGVSAITVKRDWAAARAWLQLQFQGQSR